LYVKDKLFGGGFYFRTILLIEGNPGRWEISRDKYLGTACFIAKAQENKL
jgi:hypothetical protein